MKVFRCIVLVLVLLATARAPSDTTEALAPGVTYRHLHWGRPKPSPYTVEAMISSRPVAHKVPHSIVRSIAGPLTVLDVGTFDDERLAIQCRNTLRRHGFPLARVAVQSEDPSWWTEGPWDVHILDIDLAQHRPDCQLTDFRPLSALAREQHALAATNGGYFVQVPQDGTPGLPTGICIQSNGFGRIEHEALPGRTCLLWGQTLFIGSVETPLSVEAGDGATHRVDGIGRAPGRVRDLGPDGRARQDVTTVRPDESIWTGPQMSRALSGRGVRLSVGFDGTILGSDDPPGSTSVFGTGEAARWLVAHAPPGGTLEFHRIVLVDGKSTTLLGAVSGGPRLLRDGSIDVTAAEEGFAYDPGFFYRFGYLRNPRTMAGLTADHHLILAVVDGHQPALSVGMSLAEEARFMLRLHCIDALNLDGGGSSTMWVRDRIVNHPSDKTGERRIGDALLIEPSQ